MYLIVLIRYDSDPNMTLASWALDLKLVIGSYHIL